MTYKGYTIYTAFKKLVAVQVENGRVLGFFTSLDDAMRAIDKHLEAVN